MPQSEVTLGGVTIPVYPQRVAYLENRIGPTVRGILARGEDITAETIIAFLGEGAYDGLVALIPNLEKRLPRWKFRGFASQEAYEAGEYDEAVDDSPTLPETLAAFETALHINGLHELAKLGKVIDARLLRAQLNRAIAESIASPSSQSVSGASESTSSGTTAPTLTESEDSPSPASTD